MQLGSVMLMIWIIVQNSIMRCGTHHYIFGASDYIYEGKRPNYQENKTHEHPHRAYARADFAASRRLLLLRFRKRHFQTFFIYLFHGSPYLTMVGK